MKKALSVFLFLPLFLISCNKNDLSIPNSPFEDDTYERIGIKTAFPNLKLNPIGTKTYNDLIITIKDYKADDDVYHYTVQEENRDLVHSYFGDEYLTYCTMSTINSNYSRFTKYKTSSGDADCLNTLASINEKREYQTSSDKILKNNSITDKYTYDTYYRWIKEPVEEGDAPSGTGLKYGVRESVSIDDKAAKVEQKVGDETSYDALQFNLTPYISIKQLFSGIEDFELFGENNKAVYGSYDDNKYLIREAYTEYSDFPTDAGKNYKAAKNYFYEALLEKDDDVYRFTNFRYYQELVILSKAYYDNVPVIYLDQPVLVRFKEVKYKIEYQPLPACDPNTYIIPKVNTK